MLSSPPFSDVVIVTRGFFEFYRVLQYALAEDDTFIRVPFINRLNSLILSMYGSIGNVQVIKE